MNVGLGAVRRRVYYRLFGADGTLVELLRPGMRVLDLGCSDGRGSEVLTGAFGCDIHRPSLVHARNEGRRHPVAEADLRALPFASDAFDAVTALDVVEHFDKPDALAVIAEMERVSRDLVIVMTPSGFVAQPPTETEPWQQHRCGFEPDELQALGFQVHGRGGLALLRGDYASFRLGPAGQLLAMVTHPYTRRHPEQAFHVIAVKRVAH